MISALANLGFDCGSPVHNDLDHIPDTIAIALGAFDDPYFVPPTVFVWGERQHPWVAIYGEQVEHLD